MTGYAKILEELSPSRYDFLFLAPSRTHSYAHDQKPYTHIPAEKSKKKVHRMSSL
jgi:hypothetical protein